MNSSITTRFLGIPATRELDVRTTGNGPQRAHPTDEDLLGQASKGEPQALGILFDRYSRLVRAIAARILRDAAEAEDAVQDLFLFLQRKCGQFDSSKSTAGSWIVQMAYHRAIERRRHLTHRCFYSQVALEDDPTRLVGTPTSEADYSAEAVFGRNGLEKVLGALSEDQRETLRLHFFEGYTLLEISAKLGQPLGNVRHFYYRGLDRLRKQMFGRKVRGS